MHGYGYANDHHGSRIANVCSQSDSHSTARSERCGWQTHVLRDCGVPCESSDLGGDFDRFAFTERLKVSAVQERNGGNIIPLQDLFAHVQGSTSQSPSQSHRANGRLVLGGSGEDFSRAREVSCH